MNTIIDKIKVMRVYDYWVEAIDNVVTKSLISVRQQSIIDNLKYTTVILPK